MFNVEASERAALNYVQDSVLAARLNTIVMASSTYRQYLHKAFHEDAATLT